MNAQVHQLHETDAPRGGEPNRRRSFPERVGAAARDLVIGTPNPCNLVLRDEAKDRLTPALQSIGYELSRYEARRATATANVTMAAAPDLTTIYLAQIDPAFMPPEESGVPIPFDYGPLGFMIPEAGCLRLLSRNFDSEPEKVLEWMQLWRDFVNVDVEFLGWKWVRRLAEKEDAAAALGTYLRLPPAALPPPVTVTQVQAARSGVFISYSHKDPKEWLEAVLSHLHRLEPAHPIWTDRNIAPGDTWRREIDHALARAQVAVFLVSTNFLNSDFIMENELGPALDAAEQKGLRIFLLAASSCAYEDFPNMNRYQWAYGPPSSELAPLDQLREAHRKEVLVEVYRSIRDALNGSRSG